MTPGFKDLTATFVTAYFAKGFILTSLSQELFGRRAYNRQYPALLDQRWQNPAKLDQFQELLSDITNQKPAGSSPLSLAVLAKCIDAHHLCPFSHFEWEWWTHADAVPSFEVRNNSTTLCRTVALSGIVFFIPTTIMFVMFSLEVSVG
jgi:hypothetical protein